MSSSGDQITIARATLKILQISFLWPNKDEEINPGKWYYIRTAVAFSLVSGWCASVLMHLIMTLKNRVDVNVSEDVAFTAAFCGIYYMTIIYLKNQPQVAHLLRNLSNFEKFGKPPGFEEKEKKLAFWSILFYAYTVVGLIIYNIVKLIQKPECERINEEKGLNENCGILTPTWWPFKIDYFPVYHLIFLYVFISTQVIVKMCLIISFNALEIAQHIILRINHLNSMIIECFDDEDYDVTQMKLTKCISYHLEILDFASQLDRCFSKGMFAHLTITAAICGCVEKQYVDGANRVGGILHFLGWIMALFVACIAGQHFIDAGDSIPKAIWSSKWYQAHPKLQKVILFMLARSQKGLYISVGAFGILSFPLFVSVLKMSYSILTMLTS